jgi:nucleobase:cation symporter-1, NCS1 family
VAVLAVALSGFPDLIEEAQRWITHLGNFGAPLTGVVLVDYLVVKRQHLDVEALFDPQGRYRYLNGVNVAAVLAVAAGFGVYYAVPDAWVKVVVGVAVGAAAYLALVVIQSRAMPRAGRGYATGTVVSSQRSSSPS